MKGRSGAPRARVTVFLAPGSVASARECGLRLAGDCSERLLVELDRAGRFRAGLLVCDDRTMSALHRRHLGLSGPTDVMAFPAADEGSYLGDIVVCRDVAAREAARRGHGEREEMVFCALHGLLHLLGLDDAAPRGRARMLALQRRAMRERGLAVDAGPASAPRRPPRAGPA